MIAEELIVKLKAETEEFQKGMEEAKKQLKEQGVDIKKTFSEISTGMMLAGGAITGAFVLQSKPPPRKKAHRLS